MSLTEPWKRLLILGGTGEARELALELAERSGVTVMFSLAGRTKNPIDPGVPCRMGGFGGVDGLVTYIKARSIDLIVDGTHPFASQMSRNAHLAALQTGIPVLHLERPVWEPAAREIWSRFSTINAAVRALPSGARVLGATGRGSLGAYISRQDLYTVLRVIDPSGDPFPGHGEFLVARPPFSTDDEENILRSHNISHMIVKNAGGVASRTKLTAAANLGIPISVVDRVPLPDGAKIVQDVGQALQWIEKQG